MQSVLWPRNQKPALCVTAAMHSCRHSTPVLLLSLCLILSLSANGHTAGASGAHQRLELGATLNTPQAPSETGNKESPQGFWGRFGHALLTAAQAISWPIVFLIVLVYFALSKLFPYKLRRLLRPFRSLKLFGAEFELTDEVGADAELAIEVYRKQVKRQFDTLIDVYDIDGKLEAITEAVRTTIKDYNPEALRSTVHVPDVLFADLLYQLFDYYPQGGGRGRTFSSRFGIIGLCWRSGKDQISGAVPTDKDRLIKEWGMTRRQATASGEGRSSFAAILLRNKNASPVGVFYMDARSPHAFGKDDDHDRQIVANAVVAAAKDKGLIDALEKVQDALKDKKPRIRIYEQ